MLFSSCCRNDCALNRLSLIKTDDVTDRSCGSGGGVGGDEGVGNVIVDGRETDCLTANSFPFLKQIRM